MDVESGSTVNFYVTGPQMKVGLRLALRPPSSTLNCDISLENQPCLTTLNFV